MSHQVLEKIRAEFRANADTATAESAHHYFKEEIKLYGVKSAPVRIIITKYWKDVKNLSKQEIFSLCEDLYRSGYLEETAVVAEWVPKLAKQFEPADIAVFKKWIDTYISNWAECDGFCNHTMGKFVLIYPESINEIISWTSSSNRWTKRAAAVSLILPARKGHFLKEVFIIADRLLLDKDDMVQKGYGWMLKEASKLHQDDVYQYVLKHRKDMPRTALRYAIEKMPPEMRAEAMKKEPSL
jgi:3-methyladenine DNA glycosylase AlkD